MFNIFSFSVRVRLCVAFVCMDVKLTHNTRTFIR